MEGSRRQRAGVNLPISIHPHPSALSVSVAFRALLRGSTNPTPGLRPDPPRFGEGGPAPAPRPDVQPRRAADPSVTDIDLAPSTRGTNCLRSADAGCLSLPGTGPDSGRGDHPKGGGWGPSGIKGFKDGVEYTNQIALDVAVPETQDTKAIPAKLLVTFAVTPCPVVTGVSAPVDLDDQMVSQTGEVGDERPDRDLPAEVEALAAERTEAEPQLRLLRSHRPAQVASLFVGHCLPSGQTKASMVSHSTTRRLVLHRGTPPTGLWPGWNCRALLRGSTNPTPGLRPDPPRFGEGGPAPASHTYLRPGHAVRWDTLRRPAVSRGADAARPSLPGSPGQAAGRRGDHAQHGGWGPSPSVTP